MENGNANRTCDEKAYLHAMKNIMAKEKQSLR